MYSNSRRISLVPAIRLRNGELLVREFATSRWFTNDDAGRSVISRSPGVFSAPGATNPGGIATVPGVGLCADYGFR